MNHTMLGVKLPPLPLVDSNTFLIDNSALELLRCPRLFLYQFLCKRVKSVPNTGANFGSGMHRGWEVRTRRCFNKAVKPEDIPFIHDAMRKYFEENPQPENEFRTFDHACRCMEAYNEQYGDEKFDILRDRNNNHIIESSFAFPFATVKGRQVVYTGKIDTGIGDSYGSWSFDHKTHSAISDSGPRWESQMMMDGGQIGYVWALQKTLGYSPMGYIIDGIRIRAPRKKDEYTGVPPVDATDLQRIPVFVTQDTIDEWYENTIHLIEQIFDWHEQGFFPMYRWACVHKYGVCDFYDVCSVSRSNRQANLDSNMFEENKWSPLKPIASE